ncbi:MAG: MaoC family dehydratase [Pseudomonadota bacterium]
MVELERPADLVAWVGKEIGVSDWSVIDQKKISAFAELTGDDHWIHVDVERAAKEMPGGKTIAHGFMTLSLIPFLVRSVYRIRLRGKGLNYGLNRVRYTSQVPVGSRVRLRQTIKAAEIVEGGVRVTSDCVIEIEGQDKPALVAEFLMLVYDK